MGKILPRDFISRLLSTFVLQIDNAYELSIFQYFIIIITTDKIDDSLSAFK